MGDLVFEYRTTDSHERSVYSISTNGWHDKKLSRYINHCMTSSLFTLTIAVLPDACR